MVTLLNAACLNALYTTSLDYLNVNKILTTYKKTQLTKTNKILEHYSPIFTIVVIQNSLIEFYSY